MLKSMRQARLIKTVMWIVALAFVGWLALDLGADYAGRGSRSRTTIGKINDRAVSPDEFKNALQRAYEQQREKNPGAEPDQGALVAQVWDEMCNQILFFQEIDRRKIAVSDQEVAQYLRSSPPEDVREVPAFLTNGQFDITKYNQTLNQMAASDNPQARQSLEALAYRSRLGLQMKRLQDQIVSSVKVTDPEVRDHYRDQEEKVKVKYVSILSSSDSDPATAVSDAEGKVYYGEHREEYRSDARARCDYVAFAKDPSPEDDRSVEREIQGLLAQARGGADFGVLATEHSDDPGSARSGGDLGFFGRGRMTKAFEDAAFSVTPGAISEPVKSPYGWHIIKVEEKKVENGEEQIRARHILMKIQASQGTIATLSTKAQELVDNSEGEGFSKAAKRLGLEVKDTGFFSKKGAVPGVGASTQALANQVFESKEGTVLRPYETPRTIAVLHVVEKRESGIEPYQDVKDKVMSVLKSKKRSAQAAEKLKTVSDRLTRGEALDQVAVSAGLVVKETALFSRTGYIPNVGSRNEFAAAAFRLRDVGSASPTVETDKGAYILQLTERQPIDESAYQSKKEQLRSQLLQKKQGEVFSAWFNHLKESARIQDNRHLFYGSF